MVSTIELVINRDFASYGADEQGRLLEAIKALLGVAGDIRVISKKPGSVRLTLALTPEQAAWLADRLAGVTKPAKSKARRTRRRR